MYLRILETNVLQYMNLILLIFYEHLDSMTSSLKKTGIELELLTDNDMLLIVEKGIRRGICHAINRYAKASNKYMKNYDKSKESSYLIYLDANNSYGWAMSPTLPVNGFKEEKNILKFNDDDEDSDEGYILDVDVEILKKFYLINIKTYHSYLKKSKQN